MRMALIAFCFSACAFAQLPDAPSISQHADRQFFALTAVDAVSVATDAAISSAAPRYPRCTETDPLFGRNPSPRRYWLQMSATSAGVDLLAYALKRHNRRWWKLPLLIDVGAHASGAIQTLGACR